MAARGLSGARCLVSANFRKSPKLKRGRGEEVGESQARKKKAAELCLASCRGQSTHSRQDGGLAWCWGIHRQLGGVGNHLRLEPEFLTSPWMSPRKCRNTPKLYKLCMFKRSSG